MRRITLLLCSLIFTTPVGVGFVVANDPEGSAGSLRSLHGTMITMISEDDGIPMEVWAKDNYLRSEFQPNGFKIISIQRGNEVYTYKEGSTRGERTVVMRGLGSMGLVKQIEEVKSLGKKQGSVQIDGEAHDIYLYDVHMPTESAIVHLSRETSLPRLWISMVRTSDDTAEAMRMIFRDMEANIDIPDSLFEVPKNLRFFDPQVGETREATNQPAIEPKPVKPGDMPNESSMVVVISENAEVRSGTKVLATLRCGDFAKMIKQKDSWILVATPKVRGWVGQHDVIPLKSAETYFNAQLNVDPNDVTALMGRAKMMVSLSGYAELPAPKDDTLLELAVLDFNRLVKLAPSAERFAHRGHALAMMGNHQAAIADLNKAIELEPGNVDVIRRRADVRIRFDDLDNALDDCKTLIRLDAQDATAHNLRCYALGLKGELDEAMLACNTAIELDEDFANAYLRRGTIWAALNDDTRAKADYDTAIRLGEDAARVVRSRVLIRLGKPRQAIADLDVVINRNPQHWELYLDRGSMSLELGDFDKAIDDLSRVIEHQPTNLSAFANRGLARAQKGQYDQAIADFSVAIQLSPDSEMLYAYRAQLYAAKQAHQQAIEDYTKLLEMSPNDAEAYFQRGISYYFSQQYVKAINDFDSAAKLTPDNLQIYMFRGSARNSVEDFEGAIEDFSHVIDADPQAAPAFTYRGTAWKQLQQPEKAIADFDKAVELAPSFDQAFLNRGSYWRSVQDYGKAIADWTEAWRLNPTQPTTANLLARSLASCPDAKYRDTKRALVVAQRCCELTDWSHHECLETLAIAYAESGDFESAVKWIKKALELSPDDHRHEAQQRLDNYLQEKLFRVK